MILFSIQPSPFVAYLDSAIPPFDTRTQSCEQTRGFVEVGRVRPQRAVRCLGCASSPGTSLSLSARFVLLVAP